MSFCKSSKLDEIIKEMKSLGNVLVPFNYPKTLITWEDDLAIFKAREVTIDGYNLFFTLSKIRLQ